LLHGLAAFLFYLIARRAKDERAGIIALLVLLFAPWDILYADRIWLSCVAPVWGTAAIYSAVRASDSPRWQGALVFFLLVCPSLHMSAPIIWVFAAVVLFFRRPSRWSLPAIALGVIGAVIAYAPAIYWELTNAFQNTLAILREGSGNEPPELGLAPLRVIGYAILYATSEIGYHFARGYWSPFSEVNQYATAAGWSAWFSTHGPVWGAANLISIAVALGGWIVSLRALGKRIWVKTAARRALDLGGVLMVALLAALATALLLLVVLHKKYFPHYTNLLMPIALWPLVQGASILLEGSSQRLKVAVAAALGASAIAMASSTWRYYRTVDGLNGLGATLGMVETAMQESEPFGLEFEGFQNQFAWQMLANVKYRRGLEARPGAPVRYRVKNRAPASSDEKSATVRVFGIVALERTPAYPSGWSAR
jgi:hypothetical protein